MRTGFTLQTLAVAMVCLCTATGSAGLTLGRAQSPALVGQPLDLRIQVQFDGAEDAQGACLNAEVFYGDSQVDPSRVSLTVDAAADPAARPATVRVRAAIPVNEPVVTVNLRSGCQIRSSKRYTLLADLPTQVVEQPAQAPSRGAAPAVAAQVPLAPVVPAPMAAAVPKEPTPSAAPRPAAARKPKAAAPVAPSAPEVTAPPVRAAKPAARATGRARLKLDPLELLIEKDPVLRATDELLSQPQDDGARRAEAAALWRALNASPEQILRDEVQAQRAAEELKALYTVTHQNQKGLIELVAKVERAESERYANGLVYTLAVLCLLSLAALVWLWQRIRSAGGQDWKHGLDAGDSLMAELMEAKSRSRRATAAPVEAPVESPVVHPVAPPATPKPPPAAEPVVAPMVATVAVPAAPPPAALTEVDLDLDQLHLPDPAHPHPPAHAVDPWAAPTAVVPSAWHRLEVPHLPTAVPAAAHGGVDIATSGTPAQRFIDTEELEDTREHADFFVSLGQHDKAVDILTARIAQCGASSPLLCLDLLAIYHTMGRESEYAFMRAEFQRWFTGQVPEFAAFGDEGRALDLYPQVMLRIVNLWPKPGVLAYIEDCLYQHAGAVEQQEFDLQAFRDLVLLHAMAKGLLRSADGGGASRPAPVQRAGAPLQGGHPRDAELGPDPQADVDTQGAPLGPMKVPPPSARPEDAAKRPADPTAYDHLTDFNFLNLR